LLKRRISYKYNTTKELVKFHKVSFIILMKFVGTFFKPKGMTNHSKMPSMDLKVVFHTLVFSIGTW
jgi:hypothetical protein